MKMENISMGFTYFSFKWMYLSTFRLNFKINFLIDIPES